MYLWYFEDNSTVDPCESNEILGALSRRFVRPNINSTDLNDYYLPAKWYSMPGFRITENATCEAQIPWYLDGK